MKFLWDLETSKLLLKCHEWLRTEKKSFMLLRLLTIKRVTVLTLWQTPVTQKFTSYFNVSSNNWVNRWVKKWHVFQITGQKQRFNEIFSHDLVSIIVISHAYGTFNNIRNLHHASYNFRLCKSFDHWPMQFRALQLQHYHELR